MALTEPDVNLSITAHAGQNSLVADCAAVFFAAPTVNAGCSAVYHWKADFARQRLTRECLRIHSLQLRYSELSAPGLRVETLILTEPWSLDVFIEQERLMPLSSSTGDTAQRGSRFAGSVNRRLLGQATSWVQNRIQGPEFVTDTLQILKTVIAGTAAWWISVALLGSQMPFLAPWTALLTVHATVHRSLSRGVQTTVASTIGVGLSFVIGYFLGVSLWTFALALLVGVTAARISWIRDEGIAIATTAIFVLGGGFDDQAPLLDDRIIEVAVGVGCGVAVNLLILPPLRDKQAGRYVDSVNQRMGNVLIDIAQEFSDSWETDQAEAWFKETEAINEELDSAWTVVRFARESRRGNPRGRFPQPRGARDLGRQSWNPEDANYQEILERIGEGISHLQHLTRTLREAAYAEGRWDQRFRQQWGILVHESGQAIAHPDAEVEPLHHRLDALSSEMTRNNDFPPEFWPVYGSLITSLRHIVVVVDDVASARASRESPRTSADHHPAS